jgi:hypothetical protein
VEMLWLNPIFRWKPIKQNCAFVSNIK